MPLNQMLEDANIETLSCLILKKFNEDGDLMVRFLNTPVDFLDGLTPLESINNDPQNIDRLVQYLCGPISELAA